MKLLLFGPFPLRGQAPQSGSEIRANYLAAELEAAGFTVRRASREISPRSPAKAVDALGGVADIRWADATCVIGVPHRRFLCNAIVRLCNPGKPLVFDFNDDPVLLYRTIMGTELRTASVLDGNGSILAKRASHILFITETMRRTYMARWSPVTRATPVVVPNAADPSHFKVGTLPQGNVIGFVGGIGPGRGLMPLIGALRLLTARELNFRARIAANTTTPSGLEFARRIRQEVSDSRDVEFTNAVTYNTVPHFLGGLSICLIPYERNEYLDMVIPIKLFDYMAAGRAVVATNSPELAAVIQSTACGVVCEQDAESLAGALERVLTSRSLAAELGRNGRLAVEHQHNWKESVARFADILSEAA